MGGTPPGLRQAEHCIDCSGHLALISTGKLSQSLPSGESPTLFLPDTVYLDLGTTLPHLAWDHGDIHLSDLWPFHHQCRVC
jgi:hypothetical protein